jgi:large conductance mechanosensitive channel
MIKEFKEFAMRGSVVDLAVGIVIGGAFGKIVSSFVNDILMPPIGVLIGGVDFTQLSLTLKDAIIAADGTETAAAVVIKYGSFIQTLVDFVIIAFAIFLVVKGMNALKKKEQVAPAAAPAPPEPTNEEKLLAEIRDLLKK